MMLYDFLNKNHGRVPQAINVMWQNKLLRLPTRQTRVFREKKENEKNR